MIVQSVLGAAVRHVPYRLRPWIKNVPGVAELQRWALQRFMSGKAFVHTIDVGPATGLRVEITLPRDKPLWIGTYELEFATTMIEHIKRGDICYDIGGYRGYMSGVMALAGAAQVFVFEPLPANQKALQLLCELNPQLPLEIIGIALGNADGTTSFKVMPDPSMGKLHTSLFQAEAAALAEYQVTVRQLDSLVHNHEIPLPNVVKIDVEGSELDVLRGALNILNLARPKIFLEAHGRALANACVQELSRFSYEFHCMEDEVSGDESVRHFICLP